MPKRPSRFERLTNLVITLLDAPRPLSLREIGTTVAGYPSTPVALRQAFERDKRTLRDGGIPVAIERLEGEEQFGYRIIPESYYLPDLGLEIEEQEALAFAIVAVRLEGGAGRDALAKLAPARLPDLAPIAVLSSLPALALVHQGLRERRRLGFTYHGRRREVEPYLLVLRTGCWYLYGLDHTAGPAGARRTFRVDRMEGQPKLGAPGAFEPPEGLTASSALSFVPFAGALGGDLPGPGMSSDEVASVVLEVDAREAARMSSLLGKEALVTRRPDGSSRFRAHVADEAAFVSFVLSFGDLVEVVSPAHLRQAVVAALRGALEAQDAPRVPGRESLSGTAEAPWTQCSPGAEAVHGGPREALLEPSGQHGPKDELGPPRGSPGPSLARASRPASSERAGDRLRRLLTILAYLSQVGEARIDDLAERFGIRPRELVAELELAACCGLPPYTPDELLELVVDDERVVAYGLAGLRKAPRLTPEEGFAVAAAARGLVSVTGAERGGPLQAALTKLEGVLGDDRLSIELEMPPMLAELRRYAGRNERVEIDHLGARRGGERTRTVVAYRVVAREGRWYLDAYCDDVHEWRRFQVDRVVAARPTGEQATLPPLPPAFEGDRAFIAGRGAVEACVVLAVSRLAMLDRFAIGDPVLFGDGRAKVRVLVGDPDWLGRMVLSLGPGARVLEPPELRDAPASSARSALVRYLAGPSTLTT